MNNVGIWVCIICLQACDMMDTVRVKELKAAIEHIEKRLDTSKALGKVI